MCQFSIYDIIYLNFDDILLQDVNYIIAVFHRNHGLIYNYLATCLISTNNGFIVTTIISQVEITP